MTYDIRELVPDLLREENPLPKTNSQEKKITRAVRERLPDWIERMIRPILEDALSVDGMRANVNIVSDNRDKLRIAYPALKTGTGYASTFVQLEFGARATGEPHEFHPVYCDIAPWIEGVKFPIARPLVMAAERTFWEKATAAHVYCLQGRLRGARYSRHWYDLVALHKTDYFGKAVADRTLAQQVAAHKSRFFIEKDAAGERIDYLKAVQGSLRLVPEGASRFALARDYAAMLDDGLLASDQPDFDAILKYCTVIQDEINREA